MIMPESSDLTIKQNKLIISLLGRLAFPEEKLKELLKKNSKRPEQMIKAYNLCDGKHTTAQIAKRLTGMTGRSVNIATERWEELGIIINLGERGKGKEVIPLHLYKLGDDQKLQKENLDEIKILLEEIRNLLLFANQDKIEERKLQLLQPNSVEKQIYNLCNGENSISDIVSKTKKKNDNVKKVLSNLRKKGLIRTIYSKDKITYQKNF